VRGDYRRINQHYRRIKIPSTAQLLQEYISVLKTYKPEQAKRIYHSNQHNFMERIFSPHFFILLIGAFVLGTPVVRAQSYDLAATSGSFVEVTGGMNVPEIEADNAASGQIPIGFTFNYFGVSYTNVIATSNGVLNLNPSANQDFYYNDIGGSLYDHLIAPLWDDLSGFGGTATYVTTGTSPNRVFTMEWKNWRWRFFSDPAISFQVKLFETTNAIQFHYREEPGLLSSPSAAIGLVGNSPDQFYSLENSSASPVLSANGVNDIATKPLTGQVYSFTPSSPTVVAPATQASNIVISNNTGNLATITCTPGNGSNRIVLMKQTSNATDVFVPTNNTFYRASTIFDDQPVGSGWSCVYNGNGNSVTVTGLNMGDPYQVQILEYNGLTGSQKYQSATAANNPVNFTAPLVAPSAPWSELQVRRVSSSEISYEFVQGNGTRRAVFIKQGNNGVPPLVDNTTYAANQSFGSGSQVGSSGWYCVFNAASPLLQTITGLSGDTDYIMFIADYNGINGSEKFNVIASPENVVTFHTYPVVSLPTYTFTASSGTFEPLSAATPVDIIENDEAVQEGIPLGFTFNFAGIPFTQVAASSNGNLSFSQYYGGSYSEVDNDLDLGQRRPTIAPFWDDMDGTVGSAAYKTSGTAPYRVFTFEWIDWQNWSFPPSSTAAISFQVKLYETSDKIEFVYRQDGAPLSAPSASIGLAFFNLGSGNFLSLNNSGPNPSVSSSVETPDISLKPATGQVYTFAPPKLNQSITFASLNKTFGDVDFQLTGSASSGLPLQYVSSDPSVATISGNTVTILSAGSTDITASQDGNDAYNPATPVTKTLMISKAAQTITFNSLPAKTFTDAAFTLSATASSGLSIAYVSSDQTVATVNGNIVTIAGAGSTTITASQSGNGNYFPAADVNQILSVAKADQSITFNNLPAKVFTDAPFDLQATSSSGLPISYSSSDPAVASVSGNTVTLVGAGTANITASQSGNTNYNAATPVTNTLLVSKADQVITFNSLPAKTYDDAPFSLSATSSSGLGITYMSSNQAVATVSGNMISIVGAGSTTITASQAGDGNYNPATDVNQTLLVAKANQSITFNAIAAKVFTDAPFDLQATSSSALPVSYSSSDPAIATVNGNTVTLVGAGTANITASQSGNTNFNAAASVTNILVVSKADQVITFNSLPAKTYNDAAFSLSGTSSSGLALTYVSSNQSVATVSGNTISIAGAGSTTITASQAGDGNYNPATDVSQTLSVAKANQSITFNAIPAKVLTDAPFDLQATSSSGLAVSYSSSNSAVAIVNGSTVTLIGAGTANITASQAGNSNFNEATPVTNTLIVNKGDQVITFNSLSVKAYNDGAFMLTATSSSGLPITYVSSNQNVATVNGNTMTIVGVGSTTITASQSGDSNYNAAADVSQVQSVVKANQTITFNAIPSRLLTDPPFDLQATSSSGLAVSYASSNPAVAVINGSTVTIVGIGSTDITASQIGNEYYNAATSVSQTLNVKRSQTISFSAPADKIVGDAPFTIMATATSGLPVTFTTSSNEINLSGSSVTIVRAGSVTIKAEQAGNDEYQSAPSVERTFCINPAKPSITMAELNTEAPLLTSSASTGNQWYRGGTAIAGATGVTYRAESEGTYSVKVTIENCSSVFSDAQILIITGVEGVDHPISVYPNPTTGKLNINAEKFGASTEVAVYDYEGKEVGSVKGPILELDMSPFESGLYIVRVSNGKKSAIVKVFKK
jgi:hypothetical protein